MITGLGFVLIKQRDVLYFVMDIQTYIIIHNTILGWLHSYGLCIISTAAR